MDNQRSIHLRLTIGSFPVCSEPRMLRLQYRKSARTERWQAFGSAKRILPHIWRFIQAAIRCVDWNEYCITLLLLAIALIIAQHSKNLVTTFFMN
jgi:hypothetical protein